MTSAAADHLNKATIHSLLAAIGSQKVQDEAMGDLPPYDWRHARCFDPEQHNRGAAVMTQVAAVLSEHFSHFFNQAFDVSVASIAEHFAGDLLRVIGLGETFCLPLGPNPNQVVGFLAVEATTALSWVTLLLGDSESQNGADRELSSLEQSLLSDLMTALVDGFLSPLRVQKDVKPSSQIVKGLPGASFEVTQEISRIVFQVKKSDGGAPCDITFVLPCSMLAPLVGKSISPPTKVSADELSRMLMEHLQEMPVKVTVTLGSSWLSFAEVLDLHADDVLLLNKAIDVPVELKINERPVFWGHPAQCDGQYAVLINSSVQGKK